MATTYTQIGSTITVGAGGAASINFSSIPSTYTDLVLKFSARTTEAYQYSGFIISFNGSSTGFTGKDFYAVGAAFGTANRTNTYYVMNGASATANTFSNTEIYIPDYTGSANKAFGIDGVVEHNGSTVNNLSIDGCLWSNTAAITSITLTPQSSNTLVQYSSAALYGIKKS